jgi:hypothetical protein
LKPVTRWFEASPGSDDGVKLSGEQRAFNALEVSSILTAPKDPMT